MAKSYYQALELDPKSSTPDLDAALTAKEKALLARASNTYEPIVRAAVLTELDLVREARGVLGDADCRGRYDRHLLGARSTTSTPVSTLGPLDLLPHVLNRHAHPYDVDQDALSTLLRLSGGYLHEGSLRDDSAAVRPDAVAHMYQAVKYAFGHYFQQARLTPRQARRHAAFYCDVLADLSTFLSAPERLALDAVLPEVTGDAVVRERAPRRLPSNRAWVVVPVVVAVGALSALGASALSQVLSSTNSYHVAVGECYVPGSRPGPGSCTAPGAVEVYAVHVHTGSSWPGDPVLDAYAQERCAAGPAVSYEGELRYAYPSAATWANGDREVLCAVGQPSTDIDPSAGQAST